MPPNREWFGAQASLKFFMCKFLHDPKTGELLKWLPHYDDWYRIVLDEKRSNVECPRGHGKSVFWSYAVPMWDVIRGGADDLIISYSENQVIELLRLIKNEIETNPFLSPIRPSTKEIWGANQLGFADGGIIRGLGFGTSSRGLHPKRIVGDDMLKDNGGMSPDDQERFWFGVVEGMAMPETKVHGVGTPVDFEDLLSKLESNKFYFNWKKPAINKDGTPMCPQLFTTETLAFKHGVQGGINFAREYMLERIDPATQPFKREYETLYDVAPDRERFARVVTICDPAYSENDGDATAIATVGLTHGNHAYVLQVTNIRRDNPGIIVDEFYKHINIHKPDVVGIKRRKGDAISFTFNERRIRDNNWDFQYVEIKDTKSKNDKDSRIGGMVPRWEARTIHIQRNMADVLKQFYEYRLDDGHSHDDMVDAIADAFSPEMAKPDNWRRSVPSKTQQMGRPLWRVGQVQGIEAPDAFEPLWKRLDRRVGDAA